ncbi:hypothetical protein JTB14_011529 [Gonioctena quinquepunctata]|nr:hypothetical protein JTB14_011529 [Gonioctena quinquepunctata]
MIIMDGNIIMDNNKLGIENEHLTNKIKDLETKSKDNYIIIRRMNSGEVIVDNIMKGIKKLVDVNIAESDFNNFHPLGKTINPTIKIKFTSIREGAKAEAVLNSQPLCLMSTDPNDLSVLTPGHFLSLEPLTTIPDQISTVAKNPSRFVESVESMAYSAAKKQMDEYSSTRFDRNYGSYEGRQHQSPRVGTW